MAERPPKRLSSPKNERRFDLGVASIVSTIGICSLFLTGLWIGRQPFTSHAVAQLSNQNPNPLVLLPYGHIFFTTFTTTFCFVFAVVWTYYVIGNHSAMDRSVFNPITELLIYLFISFIPSLFLFFVSIHLVILVSMI